MRKYKFDRAFIDGERDVGASWDELAQFYGCARSTLVEWYNKPPNVVQDAPESELDSPGLFTQEERINGQIPDLQTVGARFNAGEQWVATRVSGSFWEQGTKTGRTVLGSLRASFERSPVAEARVAEQILETARRDMLAHIPAYENVPSGWWTEGAVVEEPVAWLESINDAHIGMYAWRHETGKDDYDLNIGIRDYESVSDQLLMVARAYNVEEAIVVLGNDLQHIDHIAKGVGGVTAGGTAQDSDTRIAKIATAVRRLAVRQIDLKLLAAPKVTVIVVPGNHDRNSMYSLVETLYAWYRNVPEVTVLNAPEDGNYAFPRLRQYYQYAENGLMLAHGDYFKKSKDTPPLLFASEAKEIWAATSYREILAGHWHQLRASEVRGVRIRHLPGLTAVDAWHDDQGYAHWRAATGIAYKQSGGVAGIHEVEP